MKASWLSFQTRDGFKVVFTQSPHDLQLIPHQDGRSQRVQRFKTLEEISGSPRIQRPGFDPSVGKIPRERNGYPRQCSCLENSMDRRVWWATVHGVAKSWT